MTKCLSCGSVWNTGETIHWKRDDCGFCGSDDIVHSDTADNRRESE